jgi:dCTP deaminase
MFLTRQEIEERIDKKEIVVRPLLEKSKQIGSVSLDFRLGCNFLASIQGRDPFIDASIKSGKIGNINNFFQETRRQLGDTFILHPGQTILASSLEYFKMPNDLMGLANLRSSYARLGLNILSRLEPDYCGCVSIELTNPGKSAIRLTVGACMFQMHFIQILSKQSYHDRPRKYMCQVRPQPSNLYSDDDLQILQKVFDNNNK